MWRIRVFAGLALLGALTTPSVAAAPNELDNIIKSGIVRVAVPDNFPPFGDVGPDTKLHGYDIDMAGLIADALGVKLDLVPVSSTNRIPYLTDGKADLLISSLGKDPDREKLIDFSIAYAPFFSGVFGPDNIAVAKPEDLTGKTIAVTRDSIEDAALTKVSPDTGAIERYDDNADAEVAFLSGRAELIATGNVVAAQVLAKSPMRKPTIKFLLKNSPCYVGVRKGEPDLLARVNEIIMAAHGDGTLNRISERWLKVPLGDPEHPDWVGVK